MRKIKGDITKEKVQTLIETKITGMYDDLYMTSSYTSKFMINL